LQNSFNYNSCPEIVETSFSDTVIVTENSTISGCRKRDFISKTEIENCVLYCTDNPGYNATSVVREPTGDDEKMVESIVSSRTEVCLKEETRKFTSGKLHKLCKFHLHGLFSP